jgi:hypothetical protein
MLTIFHWKIVRAHLTLWSIFTKMKANFNQMPSN